MTPFNVKNGRLRYHRIFGVDGLHLEVRELLDWLSSFCAERGWSIPTVTEFGRLRRTQGEHYFTQMFERVAHVLNNGERERVARKMAQDIFTWHGVNMEDGLCRAFDVRTRQVYSPEQIDLIRKAGKERFPRADIVFHVGTAEHLHFELPDPKGKWKDWL